MKITIIYLRLLCIKMDDIISHKLSICIYIFSLSYTSLFKAKTHPHSTSFDILQSLLSFLYQHIHLSFSLNPNYKVLLNKN